MKLRLCAALALACVVSCGRKNELTVSGPSGPSSVPTDLGTATMRGDALRSVMNVTAIGATRRRTLYAGEGEIASAYSVARTDDVVIAFGVGVKNLQGSISVRARILGPTPTEIPVENYTIVNDKELKEERKLLFADDTDFFRDVAHRKLVERVGELQKVTTEYKALLESTVVVGLSSLYSDDDVRKWFGGQSLPLTLSRQSSPEIVTDAVKSIRRALGEEASAQVKALQTAIDQVQADINTLFLSSDQTSQLTDEDLSKVQNDALTLVSQLTDLRASLTTTLATDAATLDACEARFAGYVVEKEVTAKDDKGVDVKIPVKEYFRVDNAKLPRIVFPPPYEGLTIDIKAQIADLKLVNIVDQDAFCYQRVLPGVVDRLGRQLKTVQELEENLRPEKDHSRAVLRRLDAMKQSIRGGIEERLLRDVRNARVRMSTLDLKHGDRVEIIVRVSRQGTALRASDTRGTVDVEERVVVRAVEYGVSFSTSPQFALIKRASDVRVASATEVPSNFKPAAGVVFAARVRTLNGALDWVLPSIGISAHVADFDPTTSLELGVGPSIGILDDHIHAGFGWNLSVDHHREYWWISLDFLRTSETFAGLFGGGK